MVYIRIVSVFGIGLLTLTSGVLNCRAQEASQKEGDVCTIPIEVPLAGTCTAGTICPERFHNVSFLGGPFPCNGNPSLTCCVPIERGMCITKDFGELNQFTGFNQTIGQCYLPLNSSVTCSPYMVQLDNLIDGFLCNQGEWCCQSFIGEPCRLQSDGSKQGTCKKECCDGETPIGNGDDSALQVGSRCGPWMKCCGM